MKSSFYFDIAQSAFIMRIIWMLATVVVLVRGGSFGPEDSSIVRYDNSSVYQLTISNKLQLSLINKLGDKYNVWKEYDKHSKRINIMVSPKHSTLFQLFLKLYGIHSQLLIPNVQKLIDDEQVSSKDSGTFGWKRYYQLDEIEAWLDEILSTYPNVTEGFVIGQSYEGRNIRGIKISNGPNKPGIFIEPNITHGSISLETKNENISFLQKLCINI